MSGDVDLSQLVIPFEDTSTNLVLHISYQNTANATENSKFTQMKSIYYCYKDANTYMIVVPMAER